jgi:hypothetical protein
MQIIENWTDLRGLVVGVAPAEDLPGFTAVRLEVTAAEDVDTAANLLVDRVGDTVDVAVPDDVVASLEIVPGATLACRVRRAGPHRVFAHHQRVAVLARPAEIAEPPPEDRSGDPDE